MDADGASAASTATTWLRLLDDVRDVWRATAPAAAGSSSRAAAAESTAGWAAAAGVATSVHPMGSANTAAMRELWQPRLSAVLAVLQHHRQLLSEPNKGQDARKYLSLLKVPMMRYPGWATPPCRRA